MAILWVCVLLLGIAHADRLEDLELEEQVLRDLLQLNDVRRFPEELMQEFEDEQEDKRQLWRKCNLEAS